MSSVLLLGGNYYGTLAAVRTFGARGVRVVVADDSPRARARFSRYVAETAVHPPLGETAALMAWLMRWGQAHPGTVLYPTNDHLAWLFARHREQLAAVFLLVSPSESAVFALLDKQRLYDACSHPDVGIDMPATRGLGDGAEVPDTMAFPLLLKPRTQVLLHSGVKGVLVKNADELAAGLEKFRRLATFGRELTDAHPEIVEPMVQAYLAAAETAIISVSGYRDAAGRMVVRAAQKVLQRPRKLGIGLCFEGRDVDPVLVEKLSALLGHVGYEGVFEAEFIADGDRRLLIDVNPRFYSQMAFDIARDLVLPLLVYHAARGDARAFEVEVARACAWQPTGREVYSHKRMLDLVLGLQRLSGRLTSDEARRWKAWHAAAGVHATDAVRDGRDPAPAFVDTFEWLWSFARHPRSFMRSFVLNEA
jgi:predicted ATP-grasp superfamily ATP-dependent carboligase